MKTRLAAIAALTACLPLLAGCGSDDAAKDPAKDAADQPATLTKAEVIQQGDAICKASNERLEKGGASLDENSSEEDVASFAKETVVPELEGQARDLRALAVAKEDQAGLDAVLDALDKAIAQAKADPIATFSDGQAFAEANRLATDFGFKVCGEEE